MQQKDSLVARMMRACLGEATVKIYGDGSQVRDYLYVDDAVQAILLCLDKGLIGPVTVGSGTSTSVNDLHRLVAAVTGVDLGAPHVAPRPGEMPAVRVKIDRARRLGFQPDTTLPAGLAATWESFTGRRHLDDATEGAPYGTSGGRD
jgi:UDP-glucose 4-epimerase